MTLSKCRPSTSSVPAVILATTTGCCRLTLNVNVNCKKVLTQTYAAVSPGEDGLMVQKNKKSL